MFKLPMKNCKVSCKLITSYTLNSFSTIGMCTNQTTIFDKSMVIGHYGINPNRVL